MTPPRASAADAVLALDTSTEVLAVGLQHAGVGWTAAAEGGAQASARLLPLVRDVLARAGCTLADLGHIAFGRGPGAFTGLRTACAVAQGLGFGLGRPLLPIDSLLVVAEDARAQLGADVQTLDVAVAMDARMGEIYAATYRCARARWLTLRSPALYTLDALGKAWVEIGAQAVAGSALSAFGARCPVPAGALPVPREFDRAAALLRLAVAAAAEGAGVDAADALPLYLRDKVALTTRERDALRAARS